MGSVARAVALSLALSAGLAAAADDPAVGLIIEIEVGLLYPGDGPPLRDRAIRIEEGTIREIGSAPLAAGPARTRFPGGVAIPGMVAVPALLALEESDARVAGSADLRAADARRGSDPAADDALRAGVVTFASIPRPGGVIAGIAMIARLAEAEAPPVPLSEEGPLFASIDAGGASGTADRLRAYLALRGTLRDAEKYGKGWDAFEKDLAAWKEKAGKGKAGAKAEAKAPEPPKRPRYEPDKERLLSILRRERPIVIEARRADAVRLAIELISSFHLRGAILGGDEAAREVDALAAARVPVILGPLHPDRSAFPRPDARAAAALSSRGVPVAITAGNASPLAVRCLLLEAATAVAGGLGRREALQAVTAAPASILGLGDRIGRIAPGYDADIVILSGDPFDDGTRVIAVFSRGVRVRDPKEEDL
ncbi:MAG: amidohydrolase family protein [Planctomycetes bacterium]|nr:amidohydrolase family protein [Planctomycetota bacterium]